MVDKNSGLDTPGGKRSCISHKAIATFFILVFVVHMVVVSKFVSEKGSLDFDE